MATYFRSIPAQIALGLTMCLVACSQDDGGTNHAAQDMASPTSAPDASSDLSADDSAPPSSQDDCPAESWFDSAQTQCRACPGPALTCSSIAPGTLSIDAAQDAVSLRLAPGSVPASTLTLVVNERATENVLGMEDLLVEENVLRLEVTGSDTLTFDLVTTLFALDWGTVDYTLVSLDIEDACGTSSSINLSGAWDAKGDDTTEMASCSDNP